MGREKKSVAEMISELLREAAVLVGVFVPMDMVFSEKPIPRSVLVFGALIFVLCFCLGVAIETVRKP